MSLVWKFFSIDDSSDDVASCSICKTAVKRGNATKGQKSYSTTPLWNLLRMKHPDELKSLSDDKSHKEDKSAANSGASPQQQKLAAMQKQMSLEDSFATRKVFDINDKRARDITDKIMVMIAVNKSTFFYS